jgi:hypothetical protein
VRKLFKARFRSRGATLEISPAQRAGCWLQKQNRPDKTAEIQRPFRTHELVWRATSHFVAGLLRSPQLGLQTVKTKWPQKGTKGAKTTILLHILCLLAATHLYSISPSYQYIRCRCATLFHFTHYKRSKKAVLRLVFGPAALHRGCRRPSEIELDRFI